MKSDNNSSDINNRQSIFGFDNGDGIGYRVLCQEIWAQGGYGFVGDGTNYTIYYWTPSGAKENIQVYGCVRTPTQIKTYVNGALTSTTNNSDRVSAFTRYTIGERGPSGGNNWDGQIFYSLVYDRELSADEINRIYNTINARFAVALPRTVTDSLVLNLDAGDTTSYPRTGTTWYDRSGKGNNGTLTNGPIYLFEKGGVIDFDGTDDYVSVGDSGDFDFTSAMTIELWTYVTSFDAGGSMFICQQSGASYGGFEFWSQTSGTIAFNKNASVNLVATGTGKFTLNTWKHLVCTADGTTARIYVDGELVASNSAGLPDNVNGNLRIGDWPLSGYRVNGQLPLIKMYNRALSPSEVLENYKSTRSRFGTDGIVTSNLVFNVDAGNINSFDNSGTTWNDLSGNGYNGTLTNGPTFNPYNGGNIEFDGANDYVSFGTQFLIPGVTQDGTISNLTIEAWVKWDQFSAGGAYDEIISWWKSGTQTYSDGFLGTSVIGGGSSTFPVIRFGDGWANTGVTFTAATDVGKWFHIVAVKTTTNAYVYVNGELRATKGSALSWGFNGYGTIGKHSSGGSEYIDGEIAIVRLYDTNLSAAQILQNYNAERNRFGLD